MRFNTIFDPLVVAYFLGHPVYITSPSQKLTNIIIENQTPNLVDINKTHIRANYKVNKNIVITTKTRRRMKTKSMLRAFHLYSRGMGVVYWYVIGVGIPAGLLAV